MLTKLTGLTIAAGLLLGCAEPLTQEPLHTERFEVIVFEDYSMSGEPVDSEGNRIAGEGIVYGSEEVAVYIIEEHLRTGDIVTVVWTQEDAYNSEWNNIVDIDKEVDANANQ